MSSSLKKTTVETPIIIRNRALSAPTSYLNFILSSLGHFRTELLERQFSRSFFCWILCALLIGSTFLQKTAAAEGATARSVRAEQDLVLWEPSSGVFTIVYRNGTAKSLQCGLPGDVPLYGSIFKLNSPSPIVWRASPAFTASSFYICRSGQVPQEIPLGSPGDIPFASNDFDGDGLDDLAVWRPTTHQWFAALSTKGGQISLVEHGGRSDIPVPADYDGDGKANEATFRPATGEWIILDRSRKKSRIIQFGLPADQPVPADFDGDGKADLAVYRAAEGRWYVRPSTNTKNPFSVNLGLPSDLPIPRDINKDGLSDFVVYRPSTGEVFNKISARSRTRSQIVSAQRAQVTGSKRLEKPVNDFDGDGLSDYAVLRAAQGGLFWYVANTYGQPLPVVPWGLVGDGAISNDFTGDGRTDFTVVRNVGGLVNWFIRPSGGAQPNTLSFGFGEDLLLTGRFDTDAKADPAAIRATDSLQFTWYILSSMNGGIATFNWGVYTDIPIAGDFDGDGIDEATVVRNINGQLYWFPRRADGLQLQGIKWGLAGDTVLPLDFDGDGRDDYAVTRLVSGSWYLYVLTSSGRKLPVIQWGIAGDIPIPGRYLGGTQVEPGVWRPTSLASYFVTNWQGLTATFPWGVGSDIPLTTSRPLLAPGPNPARIVPAATPKPTPTPPAASDNITCDEQLKPNDGSGNFVHKPISESDGKLAVILPQRFGGRTTKLDLVSSGKVIESPRYDGDNNGGRPHFRARKPGGSYPQNLVERFVTSDGKSHCVTIPDPSLRYD